MIRGSDEGEAGVRYQIIAVTPLMVSDDQIELLDN